MKQVLTFSFDSSDPSPLSSASIEQVHNLLRGFVLPEEEDAERLHPGLKSLRRIRGNSFSADDVRNFLDFAEILVERSEARASTLRSERDAVASDPHSVKAYDGLIDMVELGRREAINLMRSFGEAFAEASAGKEDAIAGP